MSKSLLEIIEDWFTTYADENNQSARIDTDGFAFLKGEFDLNDLVDIIEDFL